MRDAWYEMCSRLFADGRDPEEVFRAIHELFSVEELERLTIHNPTYVLGTGGAEGGLGLTRFSFRAEEFVHPLIVKELLGWIADRNETVVGSTWKWPTGATGSTEHSGRPEKGRNRGLSGEGRESRRIPACRHHSIGS